VRVCRSHPTKVMASAPFLGALSPRLSIATARDRSHDMAARRLGVLHTRTRRTPPPEHSRSARRATARPSPCHRQPARWPSRSLVWRLARCSCRCAHAVMPQVPSWRRSQSSPRARTFSFPDPRPVEGQQVADLSGRAAKPIDGHSLHGPSLQGPAGPSEV